MSHVRPITKTITHAQLSNGMRVWNAGICFEVSNITVHNPGDKCFVWKGTEPVIRYTGTIVPGKSAFGDSLVLTAYNGGTYGAIASYGACVELDSIQEDNDE